MEVTMKQVLDLLNPDEPDYFEAAKIGAGALIHLNQLVMGADGLLASKAAYLASLIDDPKSIDVLQNAAKSKHPEVRVAAASGAKNLIKKNLVKDDQRTVDNLLNLLKNDSDPGVRKWVQKSSSLRDNTK